MLNEKYEQYEKNDFSLYYFLFYSFAYFAPVFVYSYDSNILLNIEEFPKIAHKICASTLATYPGLNLVCARLPVTEFSEEKTNKNVKI